MDLNTLQRTKVAIVLSGVVCAISAFCGIGLLLNDFQRDGIGLMGDSSDPKSKPDEPQKSGLGGSVLNGDPGDKSPKDPKPGLGFNAEPPKGPEKPKPGLGFDVD